MSLPHRKPVNKPVARSAPVHATGTFPGTAQSGPARRARAHVLAEELLARGCEYLQRSVWDEARKEFEKALQMEPDYAEAFNNLGLTLIYQGQIDEAIEALRQANASFPEWPVAMANLGLAYQRAGRNEDAAQWYEKAVAKNKAQPAVWLSLGDTYAAINRLDKAMQCYEMVLTIVPKHAMAFSRVGMLMARRSQLDEAARLLSQSLEIEPDNVDAVAVLGAIACRQGEFRAAREYFGQLAGAPKMPAPAQRGLERLQNCQTGVEKAFTEWKAQMPATRDIAEIYYELGVAHVKDGNNNMAKVAFQHASEARPNWAAPMIWFAFFSALDGDAATATKYWQDVARIDLANVLASEQLGYLAIGMGMPKEAEPHFAAARALGREIPPDAIK